MSTATRGIYKLFVSNLPWSVSTTELRKYFIEFGHVTSATVVFDKNTGLSKGYGFVMFSTQGGLDAVLCKPHHSLEGQHLVIQPTN